MRGAVVSRIILLILASCLAACGMDDGSSHERRILPPLASPFPPSEHYVLADPSCQNKAAGTTTLASGTIYQFAPDGTGSPRLLSPIMDLSQLGATSLPVLASGFVKETWFGATYVRSCPNPMGDDRSCVINGRVVDWDVATPPRPLRLCQTHSGYPRESIEGIGLTSLNFLERALQALSRGAPRPLPTITLEVLPKYVSVYQNESTAEGKPIRVATYYTHNLAYFPKRNRIAVFPESAATQSLYSEHGHLWESAFGMAHEAGHHLEQQIAESVSADPRAFWDPLQHAFTPLRSFVNDAERIRLGVRNSISEGFADLVAFYAIGGDEGLVTSLYRLGVNRNPRSAAFIIDNRQEMKVLDDAALRQLLGGGCEPSGRCAVPSTLTSHDAGAIIAHALYRIFSTVAYRVGGGLESDWSSLIRLSYDWLAFTLPTLASSPINEGSTLQPVGIGLEKIVSRVLHDRGVSADVAATVRAEVCLITRQVLPATRPLPFAINGACPET